ncbi:brevican core protein-like isoform X3 [Hippocampus zosterae]|uniref:brevican core protein-like isoform X3 n=2 Tax=Hippocampus zosterae TaxID=109293 RepID=UPI00223DF43C|nr:brevican core protein-like isoform X3 [Hippocampus zosterae]
MSPCLLMACVLSLFASSVMYVESGLWKRYGTGCFRFFSMPRCWHQAEEHCVQQGGHLASFHAHHEVVFLNGLSEGSANTWVGMHIGWYRYWLFWWRKSLSFTDGSSVDFLDWDPEPWHHECVVVRGNRRLTDMDCGKALPFICQKGHGFPCPTCTCPACTCDKCPCPKLECRPCSCPECHCATCAPPTTCPPVPRLTCPTNPPMTTCPSLPTCPPPQLPTSGPGNVTHWSENSSLTHMPDDAEGPVLLLLAPHPDGFRVDLLGLLGVGSSIAIRGQVIPMAEELMFELVAANDTALLLVFRVKDEKILLTADLNGTKNIEEKEMDSFLFGPGHNFEVIIRCHVDRFHLSVDGAQQLEVVNWVGDPQSITALTIGDTLLLKDVRLK